MTFNITAKDHNKLGTPELDTTSAAECTRTIIVSSVCDEVNQANANQEFLTYCASQDHIHLDEIKYISKGITLVVCKDWA